MPMVACPSGDALCAALQGDRTTPFSYSSALSVEAAKVCATTVQTQVTQQGSVWVSGMSSQSAAITYLNNAMLANVNWKHGIDNAGSIGTVLIGPTTFMTYSDTWIACVSFHS
jgi:hypothetical protein